MGVSCDPLIPSSILDFLDAHVEQKGREREGWVRMSLLFKKRKGSSGREREKGHDNKTRSFLFIHTLLSLSLSRLLPCVVEILRGFYRAFPFLSPWPLFFTFCFFCMVFEAKFMCICVCEERRGE